VGYGRKCLAVGAQSIMSFVPRNKNYAIRMAGSVRYFLASGESACFCWDAGDVRLELQRPPGRGVFAWVCSQRNAGVSMYGTVRRS
jgi:hypothetical protein